MRESIGFSEGMFMGMSTYNGPMKQMDWDLLKQKINEFRDTGLTNVEVGLQGDWSYTGGEVWRDGKYVKQSDTYVYTASKWATPAAIFTFGDGTETEMEIYKAGDDAGGYFDLTGEEVW